MAYGGMRKNIGKPAKCMTLWGANPDQANRRMWGTVLERKNEGVRLQVIDPRRIVGADRADLWLQPRPGTDVALMLGMINFIIDEELYDKEFVDKWCYGFDKVRERAKEYPLERVAGITWIPPEKIAEAARWCATKPSVIYYQMGIEQQPTSMEACHAHIILAAITGNLDIWGGEAMIGSVMSPQVIHDYEVEADDVLSQEQRQKQIGGDRFRVISLVGYDLVRQYAKTQWTRGSCIGLANAPSVYRAMLTGKPYPVRAMLTVSSNPIVTQANTKLVYKALKSLDLYVVHDFWLTPSAEIADYVLPAASWLERPQLWGFPPDAGLAAMPAKIEGVCDRRNDYELYRGLAIRLDLEKYWPWETLEAAFDYRIQPSGYKTLREFIEKTGGYLPMSHEEKKYERYGWGTPTGKVELYSTIYERLGYDPLPFFREPPESPVSTPELAKDFPLILITGGRHQPFYHSEHRQIDGLRRQHPNPLVQMNPEAAAKLGIEDGDWVWIETPRGRVRQKCQYFTGIDPRVVHAQHGWWFPELPGEEPWLHGVWESNIEVVMDDDPDVCNEKNGGWPLRPAMCKVYKAKSY
jgi:anaerobic selenocysteine-containing dehydrogenase